jgi:uncharacterized protein involved in exopolysaccharide biosynthesis
MSAELSFKHPVIALGVFLPVFLAVFFLVVITATLVTFILPESFASTARIKVERVLNGDPGTAATHLPPHPYDPYLVQTEAEILLSDLILGKAVEALDLNDQWGKRYLGEGGRLKSSETVLLLKARLDASPVRNTSLIQLRAYSENRMEAAELANAVVRAYASQAASSTGGLRVQLVDQAQPSLRPVRPNKPLNIALGVVIGAVVGLGCGIFCAWIALWFQRKRQTA